MYWVNQNLTKRIHLIWKKYWLLIFELRKIRFQNLWGPRTIEVNKITMNLIPGKILKMFSHDSLLWIIIITTFWNFKRKWRFGWRISRSTGRRWVHKSWVFRIQTNVENLKYFEKFWRNILLSFECGNSPENGPGRTIRYHEVSELFGKDCPFKGRLLKVHFIFNIFLF